MCTSNRTCGLDSGDGRGALPPPCAPCAAAPRPPRYTSGVPNDPAAITVRPARPGDASGAVSLLAAIYREGLGFVGDGPPNLGALRARLRGADPSRSFHAVAVTAADLGRSRRGGPEVVGWLELHRLQATRLEHVAMLTLAVAPGHRRQGIGRRLLRVGHQWAARIGVRKISLHVRRAARRGRSAAPTASRTT